MSEVNIKEIINELETMLPNRNDIRNYVWSHLKGPIEKELHEWIIKNVKSYGSWKVKYRKDGKLGYCGWIFNNRRNGHWQYYYTNGDLRKDVYLRNNKYHGKCCFWKINGSYEVRHYYKGKLHGERYRYRSDGTLFQKHVYDMGKPKEFYGQVELGLDK
jgi:antitoxin component YwqK of YwqJK toxin-antitoxin module